MDNSTSQDSIIGQAMPADVLSHSVRKPKRANGRQTYERLLDTLQQQLPGRDEVTLSLKELSDLAGVPMASAYHFFSNPEGAVAALAERYVKMFSGRLGPSPEDGIYDDAWALVGAKIDQARHIYEAHPAALKIFYGPGQSAAVRQFALQEQREGAREVLEAMSFHFVLPGDPDLVDKLALAVALNDSLWALSFHRHGRITDTLAEEGKRAIRAYFSAYIGNYHSRRTSQYAVHISGKQV